MILVTVATGNVGRQLVKLLLDSGEEAGAVTRDPGSAGVPAGARVVGEEAALSRPKTLTSALRDVEAVMLQPARRRSPAPPSSWRLRASTARVGLSLLSAVTVEHPAGRLASPTPSRRPRTSLKGAAWTWTLLRCADFAANALAWAPQIRPRPGQCGGPTVTPRPLRSTSATSPRSPHQLAGQPRTCWALLYAHRPAVTYPT